MERLRYKYDSLMDIHSPALLYRYAYNAFESAYKVDEVTNSNTIEYGNTSSAKAIEKINDYMHFSQMNRLMSDEFGEYKKSVKRIMEALVHKYANQNKTPVYAEGMMPYQQDSILFDEIDFNCFIDCFRPNELVRLFGRNSLSTIDFKDPNVIEKTIKNLIIYYKLIQKRGSKGFELTNIEKRIKNALVVLRYIDISQDIVDYICLFITSNEFREILINDKILFIDRQIYRRNKLSSKTTKAIQRSLLLYLDEHKKCLDNGEEFNVRSSSSNISYPNLANYLTIDNELFISKGLTKRVLSMIDVDQIELFSPYYYEHITKGTQRKLIVWIEKKIEDRFDFKLLSILLKCNYQISDSINRQLIDYLEKRISVEEKMENVVYYPKKDKYEELIQVGYWCCIRLLNQEDFHKFVGISDEYDFYYLYDKFDYEKFDAKWLLNLSDKGLEIIADNVTVAVAIRKAIAQAIKSDRFADCDNERLKKILVDFFVSFS